MALHCPLNFLAEASFTHSYTLRPGRRFARCHDQPHHHGIGEDIIVQDVTPP
jgi:hypothetical protein